MNLFWNISPDFIYVFDLQKDEYLYRNEGIIKVLGYNADEIAKLGNKILEGLMHPDDVKLYHKEFIPRYYELKDKEVLEHGYRIMHSKGYYVKLRAKELVFKRDSEGKVVQIFGMIEDVTEKKIAEAKIRESEQKFHNLYDHAPDMYVSVSPEDGNIVECNETLLENTGYKRKEIIGQPVFMMYHEDSINKAKFVFEEFLKYGEIGNRELILKKKNGEKIDVSLSVKSVKDEQGNIKYSMSSWRDITEAKKQEVIIRQTLTELERSNQELEQFAYIASHDLQEPLRMVSSFLQLLQSRYKDSLDEDGLEFIEFAVDGASRMRQLIKDLLEFSRVGTRGKPFEKAKIEELANIAVQNLSESITESNAVIKIGKLPELSVDHSQIVQLFQNLISNAIKFRGETDPEINISAKRKKYNYEFTVTDNGIGFDVKYKDRIFTIFQRLHTSEEYSGTGIGLAVCKKIVERHGGEIWVESEPGKGTKFYFTLKR